MSPGAVAVLLAYSIMEIAPRSPSLISFICPSPTHHPDDDYAEDEDNDHVDGDDKDDGVDDGGNGDDGDGGDGGRGLKCDGIRWK